MTRRAAAAVREGGGLLVAAPLWVWWSVDRGGYPSALWITGLVALAVATAIALLLGPRPPLRGPRAIAVTAIGAYAVLSALSILVASDRGHAWLTSERALLYALAFALPILWPPSLRALKAGVALWIGATLAALAVGLAHVRQGIAVDGRLTDPTGYPNATGALLLMGAVPAVLVACRPRCGMAQRSLGLAAAGTLAAGALLTQSRGILIVGAVAAVGVVLLSPARLRLAVGGGCVIAAVAWQRDGLLELRHLAAGGAPADGATRAIGAILLVAVALAVAGVVWSEAERRVGVRALSPRWRQRLRRTASATAVAASIATALAVSGGHPAAWADARLHDFKTPNYQRVETGDSRFAGGLGSNRYDYWRVAANAAAHKPLLGTGAGSFAATYFAGRHATRAPAYAHELWLGTAAEIGLPGLAALLAFVVAGGLALRQELRDHTPADVLLLLAAVAPLAVLLLHASGDWTSAFPGLAVPALGLAGGAIASRAGGGRPRGGVQPRIAAAVLVLALAATAVPLAAAEQLVQRAEAHGMSDASSARADLRSAMRWAPLSGRPPLMLALLELDQRREDAARRAFAVAHARDPDAWFPLLELAVLEPAGRRTRALDLAQRAAERNPGDRLIASVRRALSQQHRRPSARAVARRALETLG
jgi:hypothetical protein